MAAVVGFLLVVACSADRPLNPAFPVMLDDARAAMREMQAHPVPAARPIVVAGGIVDPGLVAPRLADRVRAMLDENATVVAVSFFGANTFDACCERLIEALEDACPSGSPHETVEVDVIGYSMGGLVARHAARHRDQGKRLRIARLFTIATPHQGATMAEWPTFDQRVTDMRTGSTFLAELDAALVEADYELVAYARLDDMIVGEENATPSGVPLLWVANIPGQPSHLAAWSDPRILADIGRRLRNGPAKGGRAGNRGAPAGVFVHVRARVYA